MKINRAPGGITWIKPGDPVPMPRGYYDGGDYEQSVTADTVLDGGVADRIDTGLLDANGEPIFRWRPTVKFGFVR
jgi:hypothetical protein